MRAKTTLASALRSRWWHPIGSVIAAVAVIASTLAWVDAVQVPAAADPPPFQCNDANTIGIYSGDTNGYVYEIGSDGKKSGGSAKARIKDNNNYPGANGLGISADGMYAMARDNLAPTTRLYYVDPAKPSGDNTPYYTAANNTYQTHGAINPLTGIYYYGGFSATQIQVYGFDPVSKTSLGLVATGPVPQPGGTGINGDWAFDAKGNFYVTIGNATGVNYLSVVDQQLPTTAGPAITLSGQKLSEITAGGAMFGMAFGSDGYLYIANGTNMYKANPATGALMTWPGGGTAVAHNVTGLVDLASCSTPSAITLYKDFPGGRVNAGDQATLTLQSAGATTLTGTTLGTEVGLQDQDPDEYAGPAAGIPGATFTISESGDGAGGLYDSSWQCVNTDTDAVIASGTGTSGSVTLPGGGVSVDCVFVNEKPKPKVKLTKIAGPVVDANANGKVDPGDTISYSFTVENTGPIPLDAISVSDPKVGAVTCPAGPLAAGADATCTADAAYVLTSDDIEAAEVTNEATATGTVTGDDPATDSDEITTHLDIPSLVLEKSHDGDEETVFAKGDIITYHFTATNNGNVPLTGVTITDPLVGLSVLSYTWPGTPGTLTPGQSVTATATYAVTQDDVEAGEIENTATAAGTPPSGPAVTGTSTDTVTELAPPSTANSFRCTGGAGTGIYAVGHASSIYELDSNGAKKTPAVTAFKRGNTGYNALGITSDGRYAIARTNSTDLQSMYIHDIEDDETTLISGIDGLPRTDGAIDPKTGLYYYGGFRAASTPSNPADNHLRIFAYDIANDQALGILADGVRADFPGATGLSTPINGDWAFDTNGRLYVLGSSTSPTKASGNANTVLWVVDQKLPTTSVGSPITVTGTKLSEFSTDATGDSRRAVGMAFGTDGYLYVADKTYTYKVDPNTGVVVGGGGVAHNVTEITDLGSCATPNSVLVQAAFTNGRIDDFEQVNLSAQNQAVGSELLTATTTGTGDGVQAEIAGPALGMPGAKFDIGSTLAADGSDPSDKYLTSWKCVNAVSGITIASGNGASAEVTHPGGGAAVICTITYTKPAPALALTKEAGSVVDTNGNGKQDAGDTVAYTFTVENTGNIKITGITLDDALPGLGTLTYDWPGTPGALEPGDEMTATATYTLGTSDFDEGEVYNEASVSGADTKGNPVSATDDETVTLSPSPNLSLAKSASAPSKAVGGAVTYTFTVTNTGNVTMSGVGITDPMVGLSAIEWTAGDPDDPIVLAPGASATATASYVITQSDINAGAVTNTATVTGKDPGNTTRTATDGETVVIPQTGGLSITKSAVVAPGVDGRVDAGDVVTYTFVVSNNTNVTLSGVSVSDVLPGLSAIGYAWPGAAGVLEPGASVTATATYELEQADIDAGEVENTATASVTNPKGGTVNATADATVTTNLAQVPGLSLVKEGVAAAKGVGDSVTYTFTATNTGNVTMTDVGVTDPMVGLSSITYGTWPSGTTGTLAPGDSVVGTATYAITQSDINAGAVMNTATVTGKDPGNTTRTATDGETVEFPFAGGLALAKDGAIMRDDDGDLEPVVGTVYPGDVIVYTFTATNNTNVTLSDVEITDELDDLTPLTYSWPGAAGVLLPGQSVTATATVTLDSGAIYDQHILNTATATGRNPQVTDPDDPDATVESNEAQKDVTWTRVRSATLVKTGVLMRDDDGDLEAVADGAPARVGDVIVYSFTVTNTGNIAIRPSAVTDDLLDDAGATISCPADLTEPGESFTCVSDPYAITQDDVDSGSVINTATASYLDPSDDEFPTNEDSATVPLVQGAELTVVKTADVDDAVEADLITYTIVVTNTGNVTITDVDVEDELDGLSALSYDWTGVNEPTTLEPGEAVTVTATYTADRDDVTAGKVENTATATGEDPKGNPVSGSGDEEVTINGSPALSMVKTVGSIADVNSSGLTDAGDQITYNFTVTNTGNVPVHNVAVDDPLLTTAGVTISYTWPGAAGVLNPNQSATATAVYTITAGDVTAGTVVNAATATGEDPDGGDVDSPSDGTSTPVATPAPALTVVKTAGVPVDVNSSGITDEGDTILYSFVVTNTGNVPVNTIAIDDPMLDGVGIAITCVATTLAVGGSTTCTADSAYVISADDVEDGEVANSATVTGKNPDGGAVASPPDTTSTETKKPGPSLQVVKTAGTPVDVNHSGLVDAGDTIAYSFAVTNNGNVPISTISINDPMLDDAEIDITCVATTLAVGASTTCAAEDPYVITAGDVAAGSVANTATAKGKDPDNHAVTSSPDSTTTDTTTPAPALTFAKTVGSVADVNSSGLTDAGDTITYNFTVTNTGNVPITGVVVDDPLLTTAGVTITYTWPGAAGVLNPTQSATATAVYPITAGDVTAGKVENTATAKGKNPDDGDVVSPQGQTSTTTTTPDPGLSVVKSAGVPVDVNSSGITDTGDTILYSFAVTNSGNVPINTIAINDPMLDDAEITITCVATTLAVGGSTTCTADDAYVITAADVTSGKVENVATATGTDPDGGAVTSPESGTSTPTTAPAPGLEIVKTVDSIADVNSSGITDEGDTITYHFEVTNTGNVPLTSVRIDDPLLTAAVVTITYDWSAAAGVGVLNPEQVMTAAAVYTVSAEDVENGHVENVATAKGTNPDGGDEESPGDGTDTTTTEPAPALTIVKTVDAVADVNSSGLTDARDTITYKFVVTNTGNVPITGVAVDDPLLTTAGVAISYTWPGAVGVLNPTQSATATAVYTIKGADVTAGKVDNTATATGTDPDGEDVDSPSDGTSTPTTTPDPALTIAKTVGGVTDVNSSGITDAGDKITYNFTVTNTGNVPVHNVVVDDPLLTTAGVTISYTWPGAAGVLAPTQSATATAVYLITAGDVTAGKVDNSATAKGKNPDDGDVVSPQGQTSTPTTTPDPGLSVVKTAGVPVDVNHSGLTDAGDTIQYSFAVTNTGNVPISSIAIDDPMLVGIDITCVATSLAVGASTTCTADDVYVITAADVTAGEVENTATASGIDPDGGDVDSPGDGTSTPTTTPDPALTILKTVGGVADVNSSGLVDEGDTITYNFTVTNTGNVPMHNVRVDDPMLTAASVTLSYTWPGAVGVLAPGDVVTATAVYPITATDVTTGNVDNTATVTGTDPDGEDVEGEDGSSTTTPTTTPAPALKVEKSVDSVVDANSSGLTDAGDTITYKFTVTNTGNVPINTIAIDDPMLDDAGIGITCAATSLAVGGSTTCTADAAYVISADDVEDGEVANSATATGKNPDGGVVVSPPDTTSTETKKPGPSLQVVKTAGTPVDVNHSGLVDAGDTIAYGFAVTNNGNVPITTISIDDSMLDDAGITITCLATTLAVGASTTCAGDDPYVITAGDVAAGSVANTATAKGTDPDNHGVTSSPDSTTTDTTAPTPGLAIVKTVEGVEDVNSSGLTDAGDKITYKFVVTNTGNVPMHNVVVDDPLLTAASVSISYTWPGATGVLNPNQSVTATAIYPITSTDVTTGKVDNTATATGADPDGEDVDSPSDGTSTPTTTPAPALTIAKTVGGVTDVNSSGITDAGDKITYNFTVTNTGNVPINNISIDDLMLSSAGVTISYTWPGAAGVLTTGESVTANAVYTITADDVTAGKVDNTATATGKNPDDGDVVSPQGQTSTPTTTPGPGLSVVKTAGVPVDVNSSGITDAGDTILYSFAVTNTGNVPISTISIEDPMLDDAGISITCVATSLVAGASTTCTADDAYVIVAADVTAGEVENTATAKGKNPDGGDVVSAPGQTSTTTTTPDPALTIAKTVGGVADVNSSGLTDAGDKITYNFTVTNTGNVPVSNVVVDDPLLTTAGVTISYTWPGATGVLNPNQSVTASAVYTITGADVTAGKVDNTATATGTDPDGDDVEDEDGSSTTTPTTTPAPAMEVEKSVDSVVDANSSGLTDAGDTITYKFTVTNTGNVPISSIAIDDPMLDDAKITITCAATTLARGASTTCLADQAYVITSGDVTTGKVENTATAKGKNPDDGDVVSPQGQTSTPTTAPAPGLTVVKTAGVPVDVNHSGLTDAGDTIQYSFVVTNTGNVPISSIAIDDPMLDDAEIDITCVATSLAVGASTTCTADDVYVITAADVTAGEVENTATASGIDPDGGDVDSPGDGTSTPTTTPDPALTILKTVGGVTDVNSSGLTDAGDQITYNFTVTNAGNVPVHNVVVDDPLLTTAGVTISYTWPGAAGVLNPNQSATATAVYPVTAGDVTAGKVDNSATAKGKNPDDGDVVSPQGQTSTPTTAPAPGLTVVKSAGVPVDVNGSTLVDAGDTILYSFAVTNSGNVPMGNISIDDPMLAAVGINITCVATTLAVGGSTTCTADDAYVISADDVEDGEVANTATAKGKNPDNGDYESPQSSTSTETIQPGPSLQVVKTAGTPVDVNHSGLVDAGDEITYSFTATNNGNVPITTISIDDSMLDDAGITITCVATSLAVGASTTCAGDDPYVITAGDVTAGSVANTATAKGTDPDNHGVTSSPDSTTTDTTTPAPALTFAKTVGSVTDVNSSGITDAGDKITYNFTITNTGNVPITGVVVDDPLLTTAGVTITYTWPGAAGVLNPTQSATATAVYPITVGDVTAGKVENTATAKGKNPDGGDVVSPQGQTSTTTTTPAPALTFAKTVGGVADVNSSGITDAGDKITYSFTVTNTGNVPINNVGINDPMLGAAGVTIAYTWPGAAGVLNPTESATATAVYTITAGDVTAGKVDNAATAKGKNPDGGEVVSPQGQTSTPTTTPAPGLSVVKSVESVVDVNSSGLTDAGDTISYKFVVTNTGNVPINSVAIDDPMLDDAGISVTCGATTLAVGASATCVPSRTYVISAGDVVAGSVVNTATATGTNPDGGPVESPENGTSTSTTAPAPGLSVVKSVESVVDVNSSGLTDAGDTITYKFVVTNLGNVPISNVTVDDPMLDGASITVTCGATTLMLGASTTCVPSRAYVVTVGDVGAGGVVNTATVTGTDPDGGDVEDEDGSSTTTPTTTPTPGLSVLKTAGVPVDVNHSGLVDQGDTILYSFAVTNTGNVPINTIAIDDPMLDGVGITITCAATSLAVGGSTTCVPSAAYVVTAGDVATGKVENTATARGKNPDSGDVVSPQGQTSTPTTAPAPGLSVVKSVESVVDVNSSGLTDAGDTISYKFVVTNTGNVPISSVDIDDPMLADASIAITCGATTLAVGASMTCVAADEYVVTDGDVQAGGVTNVATATGVDPDGGDVESPEGEVETPTTTPGAALTIDKVAAKPVDVDANGQVDAGDTIQYSFVVTNTGNVPITGLSVSDPKLEAVGIAVTCAVTALAPGNSVTCVATGPYVITQTDVDAAGVMNTATATAIDPDGAPVGPAEDTIKTKTTVKSELTLQKRAAKPVDVNGNGWIDAGDTITFSFEVTNTGTLTVTNVRINDPMLSDALIGCHDGELAPGEGTTCDSEPYALTQRDVERGTVHNVAFGVGETPQEIAPSRIVLTPEDETSTGIDQDARLQLVKSADLVDRNGNGRADVGEQIRYRFAVTNVGTTLVRNLRIEDPMLARAGVPVNCQLAELAPGGSTECAAAYRVARRDVASGQVKNVAHAKADSPVGTVTSNRSEAIVPAVKSRWRLPNTGGPSGVWFVGGLLVAGAGALLVARNRRREPGQR